jgi:hypothetical protein
MTSRRVKNNSKKGAENAPNSDLAEVQRPVEHAEMHESDISAPMPEPKCSAEASEESGEIVADNANDSPAIAQGS